MRFVFYFVFFPFSAAEVLASDHPVVKTRPLSEATALSKTKARRSSEFLQPYRNRPETCAALARRLVTGALGVKLATARQEREREKIVLREAKGNIILVAHYVALLLFKQTHYSFFF